MISGERSVNGAADAPKYANAATAMMAENFMTISKNAKGEHERQAMAQKSKGGSQRIKSTTQSLILVQETKMGGPTRMLACCCADLYSGGFVDGHQ